MVPRPGLDLAPRPCKMGVNEKRAARVRDPRVEAAMTSIPPDDLSEPVTFGAEAYISKDYALAERDKLWRKVWLQVGRLEEIPNVGDYLTCDILDDAVLIVRTATDRISAFHNVCSHLGRKNNFTCPFHGWRFNLDGECTHIREREDWQGALTAENTHLADVQVDAWGGWVWINLDPANTQSLRDYLQPASQSGEIHGRGRAETAQVSRRPGRAFGIIA